MKTGHACVSCAEVFPSAWEKAAHWVAVHDRGFVKPEDRMKRTSFCWRCAGEMAVGVTVCACGWQQPTTPQGEQQS